MFDKRNEFFAQDSNREQDYRDFERRYRENPESISDEEAARRYREMMAQHSDDLDEERAASPRELARMTQRASREDPALLESLMGPNSPLNSTGGRMAMAGLAAVAAKRFLGNR